MTSFLRAGTKFEIKGRSLTVTQLQEDVGSRVRDVLIDVARQGSTITYGGLKTAAELTHAENGMGRLLDVISHDCILRNEPSLAPLVVNAGTGEVGADYEGSPHEDRQKLYDYWRRDNDGLTEPPSH